MPRCKLIQDRFCSKQKSQGYTTFELKLLRQSVKLDCWLFCFSVLRIGIKDSFFLEKADSQSNYNFHLQEAAVPDNAFHNSRVSHFLSFLFCIRELLPNRSFREKSSFCLATVQLCFLQMFNFLQFLYKRIQNQLISSELGTQTYYLSCWSPHLNPTHIQDLERGQLCWVNLRSSHPNSQKSQQSGNTTGPIVTR